MRVAGASGLSYCPCQAGPLQSGGGLWAAQLAELPSAREVAYALTHEQCIRMWKWVGSMGGWRAQGVSSTTLAAVMHKQNCGLKSKNISWGSQLKTAGGQDGQKFPPGM